MPAPNTARAGRPTQTSLRLTFFMPAILPHSHHPSPPRFQKSVVILTRRVRISVFAFALLVFAFALLVCHSRRESALPSAVILTRRVRISVFACALLVVIPEGNLPLTDL